MNRDDDDDGKNNDDEDNENDAVDGDDTLLLPPPKLSSSKSSSPYPYVPPPPQPPSQMMYPGTALSNPTTMMAPPHFTTTGGPPPPHYMPYPQSHYGNPPPPPPHLMMSGGTPSHYGMMPPPHMYEPNGGAGMDMIPPGPVMMMGGPGGEIMLLDYPPMLSPPVPPGPTVDPHHPHHPHHQPYPHSHHKHPMMMKSMNDANINNDTGGSNNRGRKSGPKPWTKEEDNMLLTLVQTMQWPMKWTVVAQTLQDRTGKQCRERYVNHLNPRLKNSDWAPVEDATIFHLYNTIGSHWAKMSKIIPGRTDNGIKNRFHNIRRQYEREDTHRLRLSNVNEYKDEVRHDRLRNFPEHMSGKTSSLWDMKCGIGIMAAQSILNGSSSCNTVSGLTASIHRSVTSSNSSNTNAITNNTNNSNNQTSSSNNNNSSNGNVTSGSGTTPPTTTSGNQNNRFGPFREVIVSSRFDNESKEDGKETNKFLDGSEICVRCGLIVPSIHTGNEICTKTGWCISCVFIPPNICSNLLRETLNLRRCADTGSNVRSGSSSKSTTSTNASSNDDNIIFKDEVNELRSIIESFEEFFHPRGVGDAWQYQSNTSSHSAIKNSSSSDLKDHTLPIATASTL
jgi:hypothetical protein